MRENKERVGKTVRFSIRIPKEVHRWLKGKSEESREIIGEYRSMNEYITNLLIKEMEE